MKIAIKRRMLGNIRPQVYFLDRDRASDRLDRREHFLEKRDPYWRGSANSMLAEGAKIGLDVAIGDRFERCRRPGRTTILVDHRSANPLTNISIV